MTRAELIAKADPICRKISAKIAYFSSLTPANKQDVLTRKTAAHAAEQISATERKAHDELAQLVPPPELASDWREIVAGIQTLAEDTAKIGEYTKTISRETPTLYASSERLLQQLQATATRDGLADCAKVA